MYSWLLKIITLISILVITIGIFPNTVYGDWVSDAQSFLDSSKDKGDKDGDGNRDETIGIGINQAMLKGASDDIYNMATSIGMIISVVVGLILGITFMVASANDKAKVKEALIPYVVGCIIIFGAFGIWKIIINTFNGI